MEVMSPVPSLNELILSLHTGRPYLMWIHFDPKYGEQPCALCKIPQRTLVMTSPTAGICDDCWGRGR